MKNTNKCYVCSHDLMNVISLANQPISNRYLLTQDSPETTYPLTVGQCSFCLLTQLASVAPINEITPKICGINYNEPESHLDEVVKLITTLPGVSTNSNFVGTSYKEDSTITRLNNLGYFNTARLHPKLDLRIDDKNAGIELIQHQLSNSLTTASLKKSKADVLFARHILEHAVDIKSFITGLKSLCNSNAYIVFEVPDCSKIFNNSDYPYLWEEHIAYFTQDTLSKTLQACGLDVIDIVRYTYQIEDSLVAITKVSESPFKAKQSPTDGLFFKSSVEQMQKKYIDALAPFKGRAILFGAGHLAVKFINILKLSSFFDAVIDDDPVKNGKFLPGSRLPVISSDMLEQTKYKLCLLTLSPESSMKVKSKYCNFVKNNGIFLSAFSSDSDSILTYNSNVGH